VRAREPPLGPPRISLTEDVGAVKDFLTPEQAEEFQ